ncbi:MAG: hypothetical protein GW795_05570 [Cyanobacteria bacterium]|nr:hypothetical protein [Cyanobacteria bacterium CG_2015-16_32_12]NCO79333.1 hypothetical protein [Cyanobacteria bacterium CG_2015-22_32_23]NCQ04572.1 hypothetical protein [Cyanobacteria bacterium CG_2015-09_32_10]NCQ41357.1 hypothetical protein [Cyanobacteria bacterium CG_2015-04_32_10]NCS84723.1 hypothetical protein [Cyanobacteria bacterium CG_2015-02_32_10]
MKTNRHLLFLFQLLKSQHSRKSNQEQGYILVVALGIVLALSGLMALYAKTNNNTEQETTNASVSSNTGFYNAEAQLNIRANEIRDIYLVNNTPIGTSPSKADACFDQTADKGSGDFACDSKTIKSLNKGMSDTLVTTYVTEKNGGEGVTGIVPQGDLHEGLSMVENGYSIYALSFKEEDVNYKKDGKQATAIIQMDVRSRLIPMFQFAAFYDGDLEIFPSPPMTLNGPVHTNGNLYLGSNNGLNLKGQVSTVEDIYHYKLADGTKFADGKVKIAKKDGTLLNLLSNGTGSTTLTTSAMNPSLIKQNWNTQVQVNSAAAISIPKPSFLNSEGDYYKKADIRFKFKPVATSTTTMTAANTYLKNIPFEVTSIDRRTTPVERDLTTAQLRSLRQPVMVSPVIASIPASTTGSGITSSYSAFHGCSPTAFLPTGAAKTWWEALTKDQKNAFRLAAQDYLQKQIQSQNVPVRFSLLNSTMATIRTTDTLIPTFSQTTTSFSTDSRLTTGSLFNTAQITLAVTNLLLMTPKQIAGLPEYTGTGSGSAVSNTGRCFVSAPVSDIGRDASTHKSPTRFYNVREGQDMRLLQLNLQSLAIWNKDGVYLDATNTNLLSADNLLYVTAAADSSAPLNSFQNLGYAAVDTSQGGMVIHATIDGTNYTKAATKKSPYGFAIINGKQLLGLGKIGNSDPTGLTIASDQAIYVQGDYNVAQYDYNSPAGGFSASLSSPTPDSARKTRVHNKQPASILADSFTPLSNACLNSDQMLNHRPNSGCDIGNGDTGTKVPASHTEMNMALLSGVDKTLGKSYNGGLENYPRFMENWSDKEWRYKGSFVSIFIPSRVSGAWGGGYSPPLRPWDYDTDFNDPTNLPPLTPQFVVLKQESFIRSFDQ